MLELFVPLLRGTVLTAEIAFLSSLAAIIIGVPMGLAKLSSFWPLRAFAIAYIEFFRGSSLFWLFFVLPHFGVFLTPFTVGVLGIGLNTAAYGAEIVRAGIQAVPRGQWEAAIALNLSPITRMRRIILPQAAVIMLPPWGNLLIELLKATALVSLITLHDLTFIGNQLNNITFKTTEIFGLVLAIYYVMGRFTLAPFFRWLEFYFNRGIMMRGKD